MKTAEQQNVPTACYDKPKQTVKMSLNVHVKSMNAASTCFAKYPKLARAAGFCVNLSTFAKFLRNAITSSPIEDDITTCEK
jgi:hypothetical protein